MEIIRPDWVLCTDEQFNNYTHAPFWQLRKWHGSYFTLGESMWITYMESMYQYFCKRKELTSDGYFYLTQDRIQQAIPELTHDRQASIVKKLVKMGVLFPPIRRGLPSRYYYKFNFNKMIQMAWDYETKKPNDIDSVRKNSPVVDVDDEDLCTENPPAINNNYSNYNQDIIKSTSKEVLVNPADSSAHSSPSSSWDRTGQPTFPQEKTEQPIHPVTRRAVPSNKTKESIAKSAFKTSTVQVMDKWASCDFTRHRYDTKTMIEIDAALVRLRAGTYFNDKPDMEMFRSRQFTHNEILAAIDSYYLAAYSNDHMPEPGDYKKSLRSKSFLAFLYSEYATNGNRSWFTKCLVPPEPVPDYQKPMPDPDPELTEIFRSHYLSRRNSNSPMSSLRERDHNRFRNAAAKCIECYNLHMDAYEWTGGTRWLAQKALAALDDEVERRKGGNWRDVTPGYYDGDYFWGRTVLGYFTDQNVFDDNDKSWTGEYRGGVGYIGE